jgi:hypothetical protein
MGLFNGLGTTFKRRHPHTNSDRRRIWFWVLASSSLLFGIASGAIGAFHQDAPVVWRFIIPATVTFVAVWSTAVALVAEIHHHLDDVHASLEKTEGSEGLEKFEGTFHHYHVTRNNDGKRIWLYKILTYSPGPSGTLLAQAHMQPDTETYHFQFEASLSGPYLFVKSRRMNDLSDRGIEVIRHQGTTMFCGTRIITTFQERLAGTISIMSRDSLTPQAKDGKALSEEDAAKVEAAWEKHSGIEHLPFIHCEHLGDDEVAVKYLLYLYNTSTTLRAIYDTHVRLDPRQHVPYAPVTLEALAVALKQLLMRQPQVHIFEILGHGFDREYVQVIASSMAEVGENRCTLRRLNANSPLMNFTLLEYQNVEENEVLFGWGRYSPQGQEAVFRSRDPVMVREFRQLHDALRDDAVSGKVSPQVVLIPGGTAVSPGAEVLQRGEWSQTMIHSLLENTTAKIVRIWTTFFVDDTKMDTIVRILIRRGVDVKMLMLNPSNEQLVRSRFRLRTTFTENPPLRAQRRIRDQITAFRKTAEELQAIPGAGSLTVQECDTMPFGAFYQIGEEVMLVGLLLSVETWEEGPLIKLYPKRPLQGEIQQNPQWKVLEDNWDGCWNDPLDNRGSIGAKETEQRKDGSV